MSFENENGVIKTHMKSAGSASADTAPGKELGELELA